jgi:hypothetical protein
MKSRIAIFLIVLAVFASAAHAQGNCCEIQVQGPNISGGPMTVPPSAAGPGGTYYPSKIVAYGVACFNSTTSKACNLASSSPNSITVTGYGANFNGQFRSCIQSYNPVTVQASSTSSADATFTDTGIGWQDHLDANGNCIPQNPQAQDVSTCIAQTCPTSSGGGPPPPPPPCCTVPCGKPGWGRNCANCQCSPASPIVLDITGEGYNLTDAAHGVMFDITGTRQPWQMGWTAEGANNAFLALPRPDGLIDSGKELFGNFTPQPPCPVDDKTCSLNGFRALAVYDDPKNGGNGDGIIDARDAIFSSLRLWIDANHDGISQPNEIYTLPALGINSISLNYKESEKTDQYGNLFRYRAQLNPDKPTEAGKTAYDIFFWVQPPATTAAQVLSCPAPPATGKRPTSLIRKH